MERGTLSSNPALEGSESFHAKAYCVASEVEIVSLYLAYALACVYSLALRFSSCMAHIGNTVGNRPNASELHEYRTTSACSAISRTIFRETGSETLEHTHTIMTPILNNCCNSILCAQQYPAKVLHETAFTRNRHELLTSIYSTFGNA